MVHLKNDGNSNSKFVWSDLFQGVDFPCEQLQGCLCGMLKSWPQKDFNQTKRFAMENFDASTYGPPKSSGQLSWMFRFLDPRKTKAVTTNPTPFKKGPLSGPGCIYPGHFQPKHRLLQLSHTFLTVLGDALLQLGWWTLGLQPALTLSRWVPGVPLLVGNGVFLLSFWGGYFGSSP